MPSNFAKPMTVVVIPGSIVFGPFSVWVKSRHGPSRIGQLEGRQIGRPRHSNDRERPPFRLAQTQGLRVGNQPWLTEASAGRCYKLIDELKNLAVIIIDDVVRLNGRYTVFVKFMSFVTEVLGATSVNGDLLQ